MLLFTAPYREYAEFVKRRVKERGLQATVVQGVFDDALKRVREVLGTRQVDVIVSRRATAQLIAKDLQVPVVEAEVTDFDVIRALWDARQHGSPLAYIGYERERDRWDFDLVQEMVGVQVWPYFYHDRKSAEQCIRNAANEGARAIATGGEFGLELAAKIGIPAVLIRVHPYAVESAIDQAVALARLRDQEAAHTQWLTTVLQSISDGVLAIDAEQKLVLFNVHAEKMLGQRFDSLVGRPVSELLQRELAPLAPLLEGKSGAEHILHVGNRQLVVQTAPIRVGSQELGKLLSIQDVTRVQLLEQRIRSELHRKGLIARFRFEDLIGESKAMTQVIMRAKRFAWVDASVLLLGETGTGKELFAHSIHAASTRRDAPFVVVNCAAIPKELLESELFGFEDGAFTGARKGGKPGLFELAQNGTIFLDEIGDMPLELQVRLLRVLQQREVMRIGGDRLIPINVRVIAATNQDLMALIQEKKFREELFYRLNVLRLEIPPLRERRDDIPVLLNRFLARFTSPGLPVPEISPAAFRLLTSCPWRGNVRELEGFAQRYVAALTTGEHVSTSPNDLLKLTRDLLGQSFSRSPGPRGEAAPAESADRDGVLTVHIGPLAEMEHEIIERVTELEGSQTRAAKLLKVSRVTIWKKLREDWHDPC